MWKNKVASLAREVTFAPPRGGALGQKWTRIPGPWSPSAHLHATPAEFLFAAIRTGCTTFAPGWRGIAAAGFTALAALSYLEVASPTGRNGLQLHADIAEAKDFSRSATIGVIGAAFAYLEMSRQGFRWFGQFEDAFHCPGRAIPDFVFAREDSVAFVEAKGTRRSDAAAAAMIKAAWRDQVSNAADMFAADEAWVVAACLGEPLPGKLMRAGEKRVAPTATAAAGPAAAPEAGIGLTGVVSALLASLADWGGDEILARGLRSSPALSDIEASLQYFAEDDHSILRGAAHTFRFSRKDVLTFRPLCRRIVIHDLLNELRSNIVRLPETDYALESDTATSERHLWWPDGSGIAFSGSTAVLDALFT